jgi:quercetin dioxygenase-like cupin family protein
MMSPLTEFLNNLAAALGDEPRAVAMSRLIESAAEAAGPRERSEAQRLPVCTWVAPALASASAHSEAISRVTDGFRQIEPLLRWAPRPASGPFASANWPEGHANAMIVGPGGLERRQAIRIGVSLMAPHVRYPDHDHPQEEIYLVLSQGQFKHGAASWYEPGIGGTFHNEPNIRHAMMSGDSPLLAIWCLWEESLAQARSTPAGN